MSGFLGRYEYQLDDKGRVGLPAGFRRAAEGESFVLLQWRPPSLTLFPQPAWKNVERRLLEFRHTAPEEYEHILWLASSASEVTPDKQHRILIPGFLRDAAGLDGSVLLVGALDRIEIWNPKSFTDQVRPGGPEFAQFAHQIFG